MGVATLRKFVTADTADMHSASAERALVRRAAQGEREAFQEIVEQHKQRMFTVARSVLREPVLAEDIVQEAFIKAYRALPEFRGDSRLSTWLYRITYLTALDCKRKQARQPQLVDALQPGQQEAEMPASDAAETSLHTSQLRQAIELAITRLSPFEQTIFTLRHMQGFKLKEIAVVVDRSEGTVKNILFRAIHKMREQLMHLAPELVEAEAVEVRTC